MVTSALISLRHLNLTVRASEIQRDYEGRWASFCEQGHFAHIEMPTIYDPSSAESCKGYSDYWFECNDVYIKKSFDIPFFIVGDRNHNLVGPHCNNYQVWPRKIENTFDPNGVSDSGHYISSQESNDR
jgi:hypothetical protein